MPAIAEDRAMMARRVKEVNRPMGWAQPGNSCNPGPTQSTWMAAIDPRNWRDDQGRCGPRSRRLSSASTWSGVRKRSVRGEQGIYHLISPVFWRAAPIKFLKARVSGHSHSRFNHRRGCSASGGCDYLSLRCPARREKLSHPIRCSATLFLLQFSVLRPLYSHLRFSLCRFI